MTRKTEHDDLSTAPVEAAEVKAGGDGLMKSKLFLSPILIRGLFVLVWV